MTIMILSFFRHILGFDTKETGKSRSDGQYKKLPKKLKDLNPSYGALIRELAKR